MKTPRAAITTPLALLIAAMLVACASPSAKGKVPAGAQMIAERQGGVLFVAPQDGVLWVFDRDAGEVVFTGKLKFRDKLYFHPGKNLVLHNEAVVKRGGINKDHVHQLFFEKGEARGS